MNRRLVPPLTAASAVALATVWPRPALAAEGGFTIFPDPLWVTVLIVLFLLLVAPLQQLLFKPMVRMLDERRARIQGARERASTLSEQADEVFGRYQQAVEGARREAEQGRRETLDGARRDQTQVMNEARADAEAQVGRARREVAEALEQARGQLRGEAEGLAREAASRLLGRSVA